jgi:SAM-dependent methyltransferase
MSLGRRRRIVVPPSIAQPIHRHHAMPAAAASDSPHRRLILDQFSRQAVPFSRAPNMRDEAAIGHLLDAAGAAAGQRSLDVGCGPGLVTLAFARVVAHASGLDATPAMLARAAELQREGGVANVAWHLGDATALPFADASFDVVTTRFAWHHLQQPARAMAEMLRVCRRGGRVVVCDAVTSDDDDAQARAFNQLERLRDPSTVRVYAERELRSLMLDAGAVPWVAHRYRVPLELEALLRASFPAAGDEAQVRRIVERCVDDDRLGLQARRAAGRVWFSYPAVVLAATRDA